jgi:predicted AAA+ superfamily ATPase
VEASKWLEEQKKFTRRSGEYVLGREAEVKKLEEKINKQARSGEAHSVVSVCGIAGVGKTYFVKSVYYHCYCRDERPFDKYAWVNAPRPFKILDFCQSLYNGFCSTSMITADLDHGFDKYCWNFMDEHRCLVVIDELHSKQDWDLIKANVISRTSKSCIVVISRDQNVARHCATTEDAVCSLSGLEADVALRLFEKVCH